MNFVVRATNDCCSTAVNRLRHKNRRDFPWAVISRQIRIFGLFSDKQVAEKFATLMNVQDRINDSVEENCEENEIC